jgi:Nif-specific regulatory protein
MDQAPGTSFLEGLLDLHEHDDPASMVPAALELLLSEVGAARGYVELEDVSSKSSQSWQATNCPTDHEAVVRSRISRGVVAEALASGRTVLTTSAIDDARFASRASVKAHKLEAILCAPVIGERVRGVVYVEGRVVPGPFSATNERAAQRLARVLAARGDVLCARLRQETVRPAPLQSFVAHSPAMSAVLERATACAGMDVVVLLSGPSGSGKTQLARAIHACSPRAAKPFVELSCASVPESIFESELFGAARGAHSAVAHGAVEGKIAAAENGTLFLDEIGELPLGAQAKLLQFLQSRTYHRLGEGQARTANVRIIAASNVDLSDAVEQRRFREDLLHRLRVVEIALPPLRDRPEDLAPLARMLCQTIRRRHELPRLSLSPAALGAIELASWPGNVRQLENTLERGAVNARLAARTEILPEDMFDKVSNSGARSLEKELHEFRAQVVRAALEQTQWNVRDAAELLDVARSYLYKLIAAHGLSRPE